MNTADGRLNSPLSSAFTTFNMNIFRFVGDMTHLGSFVVLLLKILATRSCRGEGERDGGAAEKGSGGRRASVRRSGPHRKGWPRRARSGAPSRPSRSRGRVRAGLPSWTAGLPWGERG